MRRRLAFAFVFFSAGIGPAAAHVPSVLLTIEQALIIASSHNMGVVSGNFSSAARTETDTVTSSSFDGDDGIIGQAQNAGSNSLLANDLSLAYIGQCSTCKIGSTTEENIIIGSATNTGTVIFNQDYPGYAISGSGGNGAGSGGNGAGGGGSTPPPIGGIVPQGTDPYNILYNSYNGGAGVFAAMQNAGANSQEQTSVAVGALATIAGPLASNFYAIANNHGEDLNNTAFSYSNPTWNSATNSFDAIRGIGNFAQNAASNSLIQNSTTIDTLQFKVPSNTALASVEASASNLARDQSNIAETPLSRNTTTMTGSFNGSAGVFQAAQNVGSNSVLQNSNSVAAFGP